MPRRIIGNASVHGIFLWNIMAALRVRCSRSTKPLAAGWYGVVLMCWIPHIDVRFLKSCDSN